jgi:hypothetical protein
MQMSNSIVFQDMDNTILLFLLHDWQRWIEFHETRSGSSVTVRVHAIFQVDTFVHPRFWLLRIGYEGQYLEFRIHMITL